MEYGANRRPTKNNNSEEGDRERKEGRKEGDLTNGRTGEGGRRKNKGKEQRGICIAADGRGREEGRTDGTAHVPTTGWPRDIKFNVLPQRRICWISCLATPCTVCDYISQVPTCLYVGLPAARSIWHSSKSVDVRSD